MIDYLTNLIGAHKYTVEHYSPFFFAPKVHKIKIEETISNETFDEILQRIISDLSNPIYVHSRYGYLWKKDGKVISLCVTDEYYDYQAISLLLFDGIPLGKKIAYGEYCQINNNVKEFATKQSLEFNSFTHYYSDKFLYILSNSAKHLTLDIRRNKVTYSLSAFVREEDIKRLVPKRYAIKIIDRNDIASVSKALFEIFGELDEI